MIINFKQNIRLSTPVKKIMRNKNNVAIYFGGNGQEIELFDKYKKDIEYIKNFEN